MSWDEFLRNWWIECPWLNQEGLLDENKIDVQVYMLKGKKERFFYNSQEMLHL